MRNFGILLFFSLLTGNSFAQDKTVALLKLKPWIQRYNSLADTSGMSYKEIREHRHLFEFKTDGSIKYTDMLTEYDPFSGGACSNAFKNYTGKWSVKNGVVYIVLEYNAYSENRFLVYDYTVKYTSNTELELIPIEKP